MSLSPNGLPVHHLGEFFPSNDNTDSKMLRISVINTTCFISAIFPTVLQSHLCDSWSCGHRDQTMMAVEEKRTLLAAFWLIH